jgi:hypothetical protein
VRELHGEELRLSYWDYHISMPEVCFPELLKLVRLALRGWAVRCGTRLCVCVVQTLPFQKLYLFQFRTTQAGRERSNGSCRGPREPRKEEYPAEIFHWKAQAEMNTEEVVEQPKTADFFKQC